MTKEEALRIAIRQLNEISEWLNEGIKAQLGEPADWEKWVGHDVLPSAVSLEITEPERLKLLKNAWKSREAANSCIDWVDNNLSPEEMTDIFKEL